MGGIALVTAVAGHGDADGALAVFQDAQDARDALMGAWLAGATLDDLLALLSRLLDSRVALGDASADAVPVRAGASPLAWLEVAPTAAWTASSDAILAEGLAVLAAELVRQRTARDAEEHFGADLLDELLAMGGEEPPPRLVRRAMRFGVDLTNEHSVVMIRPRDPARPPAALAANVRTKWSGAPLLVATREDRLVVVVSAAEDVVATVGRWLASADRAGVPAAAGVGDPARDLAASARQADAALILALEAGGSHPLIHAGQLGPLGFLLDAPATDQMRRTVSEALGCVAAADARRAGHLLTTLRAYLDTGGHHARTAHACHVHVSTLKYRLRRLAEILESPLADPHTRFRLTLAFELRDVLIALGTDPLGCTGGRKPLGSSWLDGDRPASAA